MYSSPRAPKISSRHSRLMSLLPVYLFSRFFYCSTKCKLNVTFIILFNKWQRKRHALKGDIMLEHVFTANWHIYKTSGWGDVRHRFENASSWSPYILVFLGQLNSHSIWTQAHFSEKNARKLGRAANSTESWVFCKSKVRRVVDIAFPRRRSCLRYIF